MPNLKDEVVSAIREGAAPQGTTDLWGEVFAAYEEGGSEGVSELLEQKIKAIRKSAKAEASEIKAAAGGLKPRTRLKKRR